MSTRKKLIREVAELGLTRKRSGRMVEFILEKISSSLAEEEPVKIENFGRFDVKVHSGRLMRNPETGQTHQIPERKVVNFKPSENFTARFSEESV